MSGAVQIIRSLATDISYLNKVKQSLGGDLGDENGADAVEGALTRGANAVQHLKEGKSVV